MAKETKIEWCDGTWNPWYGCDKISPACDNCYAERWAKRAGKDFSKITYASYQSLRNPIKWKTPKRIFVCSLGDFFHRGVRGAIREQAYFIMRKADWHTYLILTNGRKKLSINIITPSLKQVNILKVILVYLKAILLCWILKEN